VDFVEVVVLVVIHQASDLVVQPGQALLDASGLLSVRSSVAEGSARSSRANTAAWAMSHGRSELGVRIRQNGSASE